jgi:hypothetical protein
MRSCEKISQLSMLSSSRKNLALRTRYKRSLGMGDTLVVCRESTKTGRKVIFSHLPRNSASLIRGAAPETPRFIALGPESLCYIGADCTAPAIPASGSTLGSHLCVALSSAQTFSEWKTSTLPCNDFSLNGRYPLTCCLTPRVHCMNGRISHHPPRLVKRKPSRFGIIFLRVSKRGSPEIG